MSRALVYLGIGGVAAMVIAAALNERSAAHYTRSKYTYSSCSSSPVDPLNVHWVGRGARGKPKGVKRHVKRHMGWPDSSGSTQYFKSHGGCHRMRSQSSKGFIRKVHVRFFRIPGQCCLRGRNGHGTFGDAHRERLKTCGHAVYRRTGGRTGFNWAQRKIILEFHLAGHPSAYTTKTPMRRTFRQCTGEKVAHNRRLAVMLIRKRDH